MRREKRERETVGVGVGWKRREKREERRPGKSNKRFVLEFLLEANAFQ